MVLLERFTITFAERDGKLFAGRIDVSAEGLCGEVESSVEKLEKKDLVSSAVAAPFWPTVSLSVLQMERQDTLTCSTTGDLQSRCVSSS